MNETSKYDNFTDRIKLSEDRETTRNFIQKCLDTQFPELGIDVFFIGSSFAYKSQIKEYILGMNSNDIDIVVSSKENLSSEQSKHICDYVNTLSQVNCIEFCEMFYIENTLFSLKDYEHLKRIIKNILQLDSLIEPNLIGAILLNGSEDLIFDLMNGIKSVFQNESIPPVFVRKLFNISIYKTLMIPDKYAKCFDYPFLDPLEYSPEIMFVSEINRQIKEFSELKAEKLLEYFIQL
ncbi:MAG: hypothetical protein KDC67_15880 [Ignavibacteriae bacterium]|nr:hypothetical protein [Ignavibacteriota bacterium]